MSKWSVVFDHAVVIRRGRTWEWFGRVIGLFWRGVGLQREGAFAVTRLTVGVPNELQMARNLTGGLPVLYQGHLTSLGPFRDHLIPTQKKREEGDAG